ncbi:MAG: response regulator [Defluviitaleaceae bacterium]|nr:response regulator [Defluviitaleaceae bacterium]
MQDEIKQLKDRIHQLETELREAQDFCDNKGKYLARMSHCTRTPITAVLGVSEIMMHDTTLPAHVEEAFVKIYNSGKILLEVANEILDMPKIESGERPLMEAAYDIAGLISDVTQLHLVHLGSRKIAYKVNISPDIPLTLVGDEFRVKLILDNLLAYAFKYTETGTIELKAQWEEFEDKHGNLVFYLNDTGVGMEVPPFYISNYESSGLGMPMIRSIVKQLGATIKVQSEPGMGTRIRLSIPQLARNEDVIGSDVTQRLARFQGASRPQALPPEPMPYGRALVVDDVEACLFVVKGLLGLYEIEADVAINGRDAIEEIKNGKVYDIIFMDHIMPEMDGITATKKIRDMGYTHPIIALTANAVFSQEGEYYKNGFDEHMTKPINPEEFDSVLRKYIRDKQPQHILDEVASRIKLAPEFSEDVFIEEQTPEVIEKLRRDFARKQKDVFTELTIALGNDKRETARWHVDTIRNMAGMIGEQVLTKVASDVANAIVNGEIPTRLLEMLNQELTKVISGIPYEEYNERASLSNLETVVLFEKLHSLLLIDNAECMFLVEGLLKIPNSDELVNHIENFNFPAALDALESLMKTTEGL